MVHKGSPDFPIDKVFPFLAVFAVANTALINMLMASRLIYGMAKQRVLPKQLAAVLPGRRTPWAAIAFSHVLALGLIWYVTSDPESNVVANLSSTTALLLLCVFALVNVACMVLRSRRADHDKSFFTAPRALPPLAAVAVHLPGRAVGRPRRDRLQDRRRPDGHRRGLWVVTWLINRVGQQGRRAAAVRRHRAHGRRPHRRPALTSDGGSAGRRCPPVPRESALARGRRTLER